MLTFLFYQPDHEQPIPPGDLEDALLDQPGLELTGAAGDAYRPGTWRHSATGATAVIDLGLAPLEDDQMHPPTTYLGWRPLALAVHLPLAGPHWRCVEALQLIERLLAALPGTRALDTEDTRSSDDQVGPAPWSRPRALASWERLHNGQQSGRSDYPHMGRLASVCLWRYRRERASGLAARPELRWPEALALVDVSVGAARSAIIWDDPDRPLAMPPVELVVVPRPGAPGVLLAEVLLGAAQGEPLPFGQAARILPGPATSALFRTAELLPAARFKALGDHDWTD